MRSSSRVQIFLRQLIEGVGFYYIINKITYPVNFASDDVLESTDILENVHERGLLTSGRHVETGPVRAGWLIAVREGRVFLEAPVFVERRRASV
jgi:hypothetical protein